MAFHLLNLELHRQEKTSLYECFQAEFKDLKLTLCLENSNLAGDNTPSIIVCIFVRGHIVSRQEFRFISTNSIQHKLDEITHSFEILNNHLNELNHEK
jgi:hypothetical protein